MRLDLQDLLIILILGIGSIKLAIDGFGYGILFIFLRKQCFVVHLKISIVFTSTCLSVQFIIVMSCLN